MFIAKLVKKLEQQLRNGPRCLLFLHSSLGDTLPELPDSWKVVEIENTLGRNFGSILNKKTTDFLKSEVVIHVHTKRSPHAPVPIGWIWFRFLVLFYLHSPKRIAKIYEMVIKRGIVFPRLDLLFRSASRVQLSPNEIFSEPERLQYINTRRPHPFPAGGMFAIRKDFLRLWIETVLSAEPVFVEHYEKTGMAEHFLERHISQFVATRNLPSIR